MLKVSYIITLLSGIGIFNSCTSSFINLYDNEPQYIRIQPKESIYGNYLAGRVAHIRQDYDKASYYYIKTMNKGYVNDDILGRTYIILASQGKIDAASKYATQARNRGDKNNFIDIIVAAYDFKNKKYPEARENINKIQEKTYRNLIAPLFNSWSYVGENNYAKAKSELEKISQIEEMKTVYNLHNGLIEEYFSHPELAKEYYDYIITDRANDMSFRALQIITNFLVRNGDKKRAENLVTKYYGTSHIKEMLNCLSNKIKQGTTKNQPMIRTPEMGAGEVFLELALLFKTVPVGYDYAQMYMAISEYFNPNNDVTKIAMADIFEDRYMYQNANKYYDSINKKSEMYYPAQMKKAANLSLEKKYDDAIKIFKHLLKDNPKNYQLLFNLADVLRISNNQPDAIKYYNEAIDSIFYETEKHWPVFYALAVSYDRNHEWLKAEENLKKALNLSNRHPQVLNYLGYSWLKFGINTDKAASMIMEAYEKEPNDGVIMDSLGWVYFKIGDYESAIIYLEKASELNPQNAVISDHLGDAYWYGNRKNEAVFLWNQALKQEEDKEEIDIKNVKSKIENGLQNTNILVISDKQVIEELHQLNDLAE